VQIIEQYCDNNRNTVHHLIHTVIEDIITHWPLTATPMKEIKHKLIALYNTGNVARTVVNSAIQKVNRQTRKKLAKTIRNSYEHQQAFNVI